MEPHLRIMVPEREGSEMEGQHYDGCPHQEAIVLPCCLNVDKILESIMCELGSSPHHTWASQLPWLWL